MFLALFLNFEFWLLTLLNSYIKECCDKVNCYFCAINLKKTGMKLMRMTLLAALLLSFAGALKAQTADEIIEKHIKALGSREAWDNVKSLKMDGSMSAGGMEINITQTMLPGKAVRTDVNVMGMSGYTIVTRTQGWTYMPFQPGMDKLDTMKPEMVKASQFQIDLQGRKIYDYKTNGTKVEYQGKDTLNKVACHKIKFVDKDGNESVCYYDATTYYLLRTESKVKVEEQEQEVAMGFDNYKKLDGGILMPMTITTPQGDLVFKSIDVNKPVDEKIFLPEVPKK